MMQDGEGDGEKMKQLPAWGVILLAATGIVFIVIIITVCLRSPWSFCVVADTGRLNTPLAI